MVAKLKGSLCEIEEYRVLGATFDGHSITKEKVTFVVKAVQ